MLSLAIKMWLGLLQTLAWSNYFSLCLPCESGPIPYSLNQSFFVHKIGKINLSSAGAAITDHV